MVCGRSSLSPQETPTSNFISGGLRQPPNLQRGGIQRKSVSPPLFRAYWNQTLSRKRRAAFPTDCVTHADRLGRRMLSKMANETSPKAADWPPTPPHPEEISSYAEGESCGSCDRGREFCLRGLQCMTCDESGPSLSQRNVSKPHCGGVFFIWHLFSRLPILRIPPSARRSLAPRHRQPTQLT